MTNTEKFGAKVIGLHGNVVAENVDFSVHRLIEWADKNHPKVSAVVIRGEFTSDGTHWGAGHGRVMYTRDGAGKWLGY